jgi:hypothetical protein
MADAPLPRALNPTEQRLDVLIALHRAGNEAMRDLVARLSLPATVGPVDGDPVELREPVKPPKAKR